MAVQHCPHCDAPIVEYKHGLSTGLARGLRLLAEAGGGPLNLNELGMTISQQTNFQKLRYWGLVEKSDPSSEKGGVWNITEDGWEFLRRETGMRKFVYTFRGEVVRYEGASISIDEITDGWQYRPDYAANAVAH